ncbi:MAG TPA: hypothetical protein P5526_23785 [Anaerolineae bacterium]|nr:hypothetical protein [Caldilineaceae bacterium]HRV95200.1 hypothetical protein [Anaerolineae bacterium]
MAKKQLILSVGAAVAVVSIMLLVGLVIAAPAYSRSTLSGLLAPTSTPTPPPGDVIPLNSIEELTSLNATVKIDVNGLINDKRAQGDLTAALTTNDQGKSQITVTGDLLGDIAAQVGGSLVGLFTPSSVDIYKVPDGAYIVINTLFPICVKPANSKSTAEMDEISPQSLLSMVTNSEVARGQLVGEETLNGVAVKHYVINGDAFLAAARESSDPKLSAFGEALWSADDADLYVDIEGGYPIAFNGSFSGAYEPLKFEGDFAVQIELTGINTNVPINLPNSCNKPITP